MNVSFALTGRISPSGGITSAGLQQSLNLRISAVYHTFRVMDRMLSPREVSVPFYNYEPFYIAMEWYEE